MGEIKVRLYGAFILNEEVKKDKKRIRYGVPLPIDGPISIQEALNRLNVPMKDVFLVAINSKPVMLDKELKDGDTLHVFPMIAGG